MNASALLEMLIGLAGSSRLAEQLAAFQPRLTLPLLKELIGRTMAVASREPHVALSMADLVTAVAIRLNTDEARGLADWTQGVALNAAGFYADSLKHNLRAEAVFRRQANLARVAGLQINRVATLRNMGAYHDAIILAAEAQETLAQLPDANLLYRAILADNVGWAHKQTGAMETALRCYQEARALYDDLGHTVSRASAVLMTGLIRLQQGAYAEAEAHLQEAHASFLAADVPQEAARAEVNLGLLAHQRGDHLAALRYLEAARGRFVRANDALDVAEADLHRALVYQDLNLLPEAIQLAQTAERVFRQRHDRGQEIEAIITRAQALRASGQLRLADRQMSRARRRLRQLGALPALYRLDVARAALALDAGRVDTARRIGQRLQRLPDLAAFPLLRLKLHLLLARCALAAEPPRRDVAAVQCVRGFDLAEALGVSDLLVPLYHVRGQVRQLDGQPDAAQAAFQAAMRLIERQRLLLQVDDLQLHYLADKLPVYQADVDLAHRLSRAEPARLPRLAVSLNLSHTAPFQSGGDAPTDGKDTLGQELNALRARWAWLQRQRDRAWPAAETAAAGHGDAAGQLETMHTLETQIADLVQRRSVQQAARVNAALPDVDAALPDAAAYGRLLRAALPAAGALIHFYEAQGQCHALLLTADGFQQAPDLCSTAWLAQFIRAWRFFVTRLLGRVTTDADAWTTAHGYLAALHARLVAPLRPYLDGVRRAAVVMPPAWHPLPLAAAYDGARYWVEGLSLAYVTAPDVLLQRSEVVADAGGGAALLVGHGANGRLSHTAREVAAVRRALPPVWQATAYVDEAATLAAVRAALPGSRLIHVAAHAVFRPDNPLFSWIGLADGQLTLADVAHSRLAARPLVVLSACESGRGVPRGGGMAGMARSFLAAGAAGLIVSQWQAEDAVSARLMGAFYDVADWLTDPALALGGVQRGLAREGVQPALWANYVYIAG
ncbi:MAG: CHAT domain-containing protein [Anaerolineales bacterium]|nr:CHAT domain-containing protein [Anaerolineales bacterium]